MSGMISTGAAVRYTVDPLDLPSHRIHVTIEIDSPAKGDSVVKFAMPVWTPGSYIVKDFSRNVRDVKATGKDGQDLAVAKTEKNTWEVSVAGKGGVRFSYTVYGHELTSGGMDITPEHIYINGACAFCEVVGSKEKPLELEIHPPAGWKVYTELKELTKDPPRFAARNFDELIDSPIDVGTPLVSTIRPTGVPHNIVFCGRYGSIPSHAVEEDVAKIVEAARKLFGTLPMEHYTFFYHLGAHWDGGLEHCASTSIVMPRTVFHPKKEYEGFLDVTCHEYFHLFNVKRIHPEVLGPFDYSKENYTKMLWVMEGTTDYYTYLLLRRATLFTPKKYLTEVAKQIKTYLGTPGRLVQSLEESSFDTWIDLYKRFEATKNTSISYYLKGGLVSMCMDLELRKRTSGKKSLDDVMRRLWEQYGSKGKGIPEDALPAEVEIATSEDIRGFFKSYVSGTAEIDFGLFLGYAGLKLDPEKKDTKAGDDEDETPGYLGVETEKNLENPKLTVVLDGSPAHRGGLSPGDELVAVDGSRVTYDGLAAAMKRYSPGDKVTISFFRRGWLDSTEVILGKPPPEKWVISLKDSPSAEETAVLEGWLEAASKDLSK